jgi:hypothetical protein
MSSRKGFSEELLKFWLFCLEYKARSISTNIQLLLLRRRRLTSLQLRPERHMVQFWRPLP